MSSGPLTSKKLGGFTKKNKNKKKKGGGERKRRREGEERGERGEGKGRRRRGDFYRICAIIPKNFRGQAPVPPCWGETPQTPPG